MINNETMKLINEYVEAVCSVPYSELTEDTKTEFNIIMSLMQHHLSKAEGNPLVRHLDKMEKCPPGLVPSMLQVADKLYH
ncbi:hypothetical protein ACFL3Y_01405 [Pseudomonadota bacterium]